LNECTQSHVDEQHDYLQPGTEVVNQVSYVDVLQLSLEIRWHRLTGRVRALLKLLVNLIDHVCLNVYQFAVSLPQADGERRVRVVPEFFVVTATPAGCIGLNEAHIGRVRLEPLPKMNECSAGWPPVGHVDRVEIYFGAQ
jgi:hypothetical protein